MTEQTRPLGRLQITDDRDQSFLIQPRLLQVPKEQFDRRYRYWWASGWWGDQGYTSQCVAYAWLHWAEDGPVTHAPRARGADPLAVPTTVYNRAQELDEWPGSDYEGTSVRAGAKVLKELGVISGYRWAWDLDTAINALLTLGPLVVGSTWHLGMFYPDKDGVIYPDGEPVGGHAYVANGVNLDKKMIRIKNSWGRMWGRNGYAYMKFEDFGKLIDDYGEVCIADEVTVT